MPRQANAEHDPQLQNQQDNLAPQPQAVATNTARIMGKEIAQPQQTQALPYGTPVAASVERILGKKTTRDASKKGEKAYENLPIPKVDIEALAKQYDGMELVKAVFEHYRSELIKAKIPRKGVDRVALKYICKHFGLRPVEGGNRLTSSGGIPSLSVAEFANTFNSIRRNKAQEYLQGQKARRKSYSKQLQVNNAQRRSKTIPEVKSNPVDKDNVDPKHKYQKETSFLRKLGVVLYGNGKYAIFGGMKGSAKGEFNFQEFSKFAGLSFGGKKGGIFPSGKVYKLVNKLVNAKKITKLLSKGSDANKVTKFLAKGSDHLAQSYKYLKSADDKAKQLRENAHDLTGLEVALDELIFNIIGRLGRHLNESKDIQYKQKTYNTFNQLLQKGGLPSMDHEVYQLQKINPDQSKPYYKASKKHLGYYIQSNSYDNSYASDDDSQTLYYKIGKNSKMESTGYLNQKK